jgi:altronate hydrolase
MHNIEIDNNPSVGNKAGGLTTIYEKSLGAVAKGGSTPLTAVYDYAEPVTARGFTFMDSPGYDPVSVTGQVAGGCNLVLFTTGRGSVFGFKPAPSIKICTNTPTYEHMIDDMDLNAGRVLEGEDMAKVAADLLDLTIAVASGKPSKSEAQGVGEAEFNPWNLGGTL